MPDKKTSSHKAGDKVETVHGEKLVVLQFDPGTPVTKKGVVLRKGTPRVLAESGGHRCWFPLSKLH